MINGTLNLQHLHAAQPYQQTPHFHEIHELLFTMNDDSIMYINQDEYSIRAGTLTFIAPGSLHAKINSDFRQINSFVIHYPSLLLQELSTPATDLYSLFGDLSTCLQLSYADITRILFLFEQMEIEKEKNGGDLYCITYFAQILLIASRCMKLYGKVKPSHFIREDKWLAPILQYIDSHLTQPLTLDQLASHFFISKGTLCHTFKKKTSFTVVTYINMHRIRYACILLREGYSVQETCTKSGFTSTEHFIRTFTAFVNTTPGKYAKSLRNGQNVSIPLAVYKTDPDEPE